MRARAQLDEIRDYFGEEIAIYFAFVQALTRSLLYPSCVGLVAVVGGWAYGSADNPLCPLYSLFILVWVTWFVKAWTREEARLAAVAEEALRRLEDWGLRRLLRGLSVLLHRVCCCGNWEGGLLQLLLGLLRLLRGGGGRCCCCCCCCCYGCCGV